MSGVTEHVDVAVPVRTAYDQWTQFEEFPQFMEGVQEIRQLSDTMTHWTVEIAGVKREFDAEITEQLPDERVAWRSTGGTQHSGVVTFHRLDENTSRSPSSWSSTRTGSSRRPATSSAWSTVGPRATCSASRRSSSDAVRRPERGAGRSTVRSPDPRDDTHDGRRAYPAASPLDRVRCRTEAGSRPVCGVVCDDGAGVPRWA